MERDNNCFHGKRALITGGSRGIGRDIARALYKKGAHVIITGRDDGLIAEAAAEMPNIQTLRVDHANWKATEEAIKKALPVDFLVNNAGVTNTKPFGQYEERDVLSVFAVNFNSVLNVSQIVANDWIARKVPGVVVNMSSISSTRPLQDHTVYCAGKAALDSLTRSMALELGPSKIRVNSVNPTIVYTDMGRQAWSDPVKAAPMMARTPLRQFAETEDVVKATLFLLSDDSSCLTGVRLPVDGGFTAV